MRLRPLGGMGLTLSLCVYICMCVCVCVYSLACMRVMLIPVIMGKSNLPAPQLPFPLQLERGEPEFSVSRGVTAGTCEKRTGETTSFAHLIAPRG